MLKKWRFHYGKVKRLMAELTKYTSTAYTGGLDVALTTEEKCCAWIEKVGWVRVHAACMVYTCRRLIDLSIAGTAVRSTAAMSCCREIRKDSLVVENVSTAECHTAAGRRCWATGWPSSVSERVRPGGREACGQMMWAVVANQGKTLLCYVLGSTHECHCYCKLQYKWPTHLEFSIENAERMKNSPWKMMILYWKVAICLQFEVVMRPICNGSSSVMIFLSWLFVIFIQFRRIFRPIFPARFTLVLHLFRSWHPKQVCQPGCDNPEDSRIDRVVRAADGEVSTSN